MKRYKGIKIVLIAVAAALAVAMAGAWFLFGTQFTAADTIEKPSRHTFPTVSRSPIPPPPGAITAAPRCR